MTTAQARPEKGRYLLVEFAFGDPLSLQYARYTDLDENVGNFISTPDMKVSFPKNTATFGEAECPIELGIDAFTSVLASGYRHSPVYVVITEVTKPLTGGPSATNAVRFRGRVMRSIKNYQGRADSVLIKCSPIKARLDVEMGLAANPQCNNTLFGPGCALVRSLFQKGMEISAINGKIITVKTPNNTITAPFAPGGNTDRYWERGYLEKDGLQIGIFTWVLTDPTHMVMRSKPPPTWLLAGSNSVLAVPGCHKTPFDCEFVWDNLEGQAGVGGFNGFGFAIPAYNPLFENPA